MRLIILTLVFLFSGSLPLYAKCSKDDVCKMIGKMSHFAILDKCPDAGPILVECKKGSEKGLKDLPKPNFVDNKDGTVTDTVNKLLWLKKGVNTKKLKFRDANIAAATKTFANQEGWRLPTLAELKTLLHNERIINVSGKKAWINPMFDDGSGHYYWSTTTCDKVGVIVDRFQEKICQSGSRAAWLVHFNINAVFFFDTSLEKPFIWPVKNLQ